MIEADFWAAWDKLIGVSKIYIDRPKGTAHPKYPDCIYPVNYGYLESTNSMDGNGIDLWLGTDPSQQLDALICTVDLLKRDSEVKLLIGCTDLEKELILNFHNDSEFMKGILIKRKV